MNAPRHDVIAHLDLDCFFAQAEELDDPDIRGQPVIVGPRPPVFKPDGTIDHTKSGRGIVCTANYPARAFGVRTAMPAARAHRLCPNAHYRKPRGERYRELSKLVFDACLDFTPTVRPVGIDEAYLELTGLERWTASRIADDPDEHEQRTLDAGTLELDWPLLLARRLQRHIRHATQLDASIGVGPNRNVAKLASDFDKPVGCTAVRPALAPDFVASLRLKDMRGVGPATLDKLHTLGITHAAHIVRTPRDQVADLLGELGTRIHDAAHAKPSGMPAEREQRKSISRDTTFGDDIPLDAAGTDTLRATITRLLEKATYALRREGLFAQTAGVRVRYADFSEHLHERALARAAPDTPASDDDADLRPLALQLFDEVVNTRASSAQRSLGVRLVGVKLSRLTEHAQQQLAIDDNPERRDRRRDLHRAADAIRDKLGSAAITSAAALSAKRADPSRVDQDHAAREASRRRS